MFFAETNSTDPAFNLAFEEYVLLNKTQGDWLLLWQNRNAVIVGLNQNTPEEINSSFVERHNIAVVRRITGGGAVYHDMGNLNYSFITDVGSSELFSAKPFTDAICRALAELGVKAEATGRNDICIDGRKVSGTAQRIHKNRVLHHGTLLFDSNLEMVAGALKSSPGKFVSKSAKSVRSRVCNIRDCLGYELDMTSFIARLKALLTAGDFENVCFSRSELAAVEQLAEEKYRSWQWNFGKSPAYSFKNSNRFDGGSLEVRANIEHGLIKDIRFYGDYMSRCPGDTLESALCGHRYEKGVAAAIFSAHPISDIFGSISADEVLGVMFP